MYSFIEKAHDRTTLIPYLSYTELKRVITCSELEGQGFFFVFFFLQEGVGKF